MAGRYFGHKVSWQGMEFDSMEELRAYMLLRDRERRGEISQLRRQVSFEIIPKLVQRLVKHMKTKDKVVERTVSRQKVYTCDFLYREGGRIVILEVKNYFTKQARDYPLRRDLMAKKILEHNERRNRDVFSFQEYNQEKNGKYKINVIV